jgi:SAM-dependent methyltransferase
MTEQPSIADDPLLRQILVSGRVSDGEVERVLTLARRGLLRRARAGDSLDPPLTEFFCALASQCFLNEYVFAETEAERAGVERLYAQLGERLRTAGEVPPAWLVAVAAFRPLHSIDGAETLLGRAWPDAIDELLTLQLREPLEERALRAELPALTAVDDPVSRAVQAQYEENPYPRWVTAAPAVKPLRLDAFVREKFPHAALDPIPGADAPEVLIAGCGTGSHPIETFRRFVGARVLAIDLSRASLAYALRKTQALGLPITYAQADILAMDRVGRGFDLIEASGSLHHLGDPAAGWRGLLRCLRPGGLMLVGLYSGRARADVNTARAAAAARGYRGTAAEIRRFRQEALAWPDGTPGRSVTQHGDFYSTSGCRDLLFHVQEHQYELPEIAAFIEAENLRFLGFDLDQRILRAFAAAHPDDPAMVDLDAWHRFECANPGIFTAMYQFWIQKPSNQVWLT